MNIMLFATSTRMPHPLGMLIIIMFLFFVGGFHLRLLLCIQNCKMSIFTELPFVVNLFFHCNILDFFDVSFPLIYRSLTMRSG
jgi:hypothetical protein